MSFTNRNNAWILVSALVFVSFQYIMTFRNEYGWMIYLHSSKWLLFLKFLGALLVVFSPLVLFCIFRDYIKSRLNLVFYTSLWAIIFIAYSFFIGFTDTMRYLIPVKFNMELLTIVGILLTCIEVVTSPTRSFANKIDLNRWKEIASPEWMVPGLLICISFFVTHFVRLDINVDQHVILIWLQVMVLAALYYLFYWINHHYLVDRIYRKSGLFYYGAAVLTLIMLFYTPIVGLIYYLPALKPLLKYQLGQDWVGLNPPTAFWSIAGSMPVMMMWMTIPLTILIQWLNQTNKIKALESDKVTSELNLLKQQINPHFFFNTLNNVYSMSLTKDPNTSEGIRQLSDLMRYVIYKGKEQTVSLLEEVKYIEDYLELQKLRIHQDLDLKFTSHISDPDLQVTPLLFIILIENAFKHGIEGASEPAILHISLIQNDDEIKFECVNSFEEMKLSTPGLGLKNLKRRLALIYPQSHHLKFHKTTDRYKCELSIKLL